MTTPVRGHIADPNTTDTAINNQGHHRPDISADTAAMLFYDIESLDNVFSVVTLGIQPSNGAVFLDVYHLIDDPALCNEMNSPATQHELIAGIINNNPALETISVTANDIQIHDLHDMVAVDRLATMMAVSADLNVHIPDTKEITCQSDRFGNVSTVTVQKLLPSLRPVVCDTHHEYNPARLAHALCAGYNSYKYDTTMLALYFELEYADIINYNNLLNRKDLSTTPDPDLEGNIQRVKNQIDSNANRATAKKMREYNNALFAQEAFMPGYLFNNSKLGQHPWSNYETTPGVIRNNMLKSGRHIDVSRFNEVQSMTSLKRHLGQLGHQLLESDRLSGENTTLTTSAELIELLIYNVSDVMGLKLLFDHPLYANSFNQRAQLLKTYPECIYEKRADAYAPDIRPEAVDKKRLTIDSPSAQFVARVLSPYSNLEDLDSVSFNYPHPDVAAELGIAPFNVLEEAKKFFDDNIADHSARDAFQQIYNYYKSIEGKNFNEKKAAAAGKLSDIPTLPNNIPYYRADGTWSTGFVTFSTGGIHGAEYFNDQFHTDLQDYNARSIRLEKAKELCGGDAAVMKAMKEFEFVNEFSGQTETVKRRDVLTKISTDNPQWKEYATGAKKKPEIFTSINNKDKPDHESTRLAPRYKYTSLGDCIHEDFTSYYPLLLKNMRAFYNPELGEDRYSKIFDQKEYYGKLLKDTSIPQELRDNYSVLRSGAKLLLNAASGAGDAGHDTTIRMNNRIISMRIIGQLFLWRIGQAQTLAGATIISTNTDGIYSAHIDPALNNAVLKREQSHIHVDIEPENLTLVSKDSNNRVEFVPASSGDTDRVVAAAGGALACWNGPNPSKKLSGEAITQYVIVEYFKRLTLMDDGEAILREDLDRDIVRSILHKAHDAMDAPKLITMYQRIIAPNVHSLLYAVDYVPGLNAIEDTEEVALVDRNPRAIGKNNRVLIVDPDKARALGLEVVNIAAAKATPIPAQARTNPTDADREKWASHPVAEYIYADTGVDRNVRTSHKLSLGRHTGLNPEVPVIIHNHSIHHPPRGVVSPEELIKIINWEAYVDIAIEKFNSDWRNTLK